jgi:hypothetical protein
LAILLSSDHSTDGVDVRARGRRLLSILGPVVATVMLITGAAAAPAPPGSAPVAVAQPLVAAPAADLAHPVAGAPCGARARACVDLSANQAWLMRGGVVEYGPVPIAHGRTGYRTPPGTFAVTFKSRHHVSSIYDVPMPYAVFFNRGIAFHHGDLGSQSHGCIRLSATAAQTFFNALQPGNVVQVVP